jgi:nucleoside 2-deoxyribosyltransferase
LIKLSLPLNSRHNCGCCAALVIAMSLPKVYLAGPGVFRHDAATFAAGLKRLCADHRLDPLWPLDNAVAPDSDRARQAAAIRLANEAMIRAAAAVVAEISPFRGPNMDPGTAYEIGFALAQGLPVFAWSDDARSLLARTAGDAEAGDRVIYDADMFEIENFGLSENLMIATAVRRIDRTADDAIAACAAYLGGAPAAR